MKKQKKKQKKINKFKLPKGCPRCGKNEAHLCPPFGGDPGIFICDPNNLKQRKRNVSTHKSI